MEASQQQKSAINYRANEFPDEIIQLMELTARLACQIDDTPLSAQKMRRDLKVVYKNTTRQLKDRAQYYYEKRKLHFGFEHLRLRKLVIVCNEILKTL